MAVSELHQLSIAEAASGLRRRDFSPVELTRACLDRIGELDEQLHSFITVTEEIALSQARRAESELARGLDRGPLHGIPIALKDLYATEGIRTTANSWVLLDWVPEEDAAVVGRLKDAGAVMLGKLTMDEIALYGPSFDTPFPPARNPWSLDRVPGGSSSGSGVAVAAGLCLGSLGSDTGASIRSPASLCGVVGLKPTYGLVSRRGAVPVSWSRDHVGPICGSVEDAAIMLQAIAGHDPRDPTSAKVDVPDYRGTLGRGAENLRVGVPWRWFDRAEKVDSETQAAVREAIKVLQGLGMEVVEVSTAPFEAADDVLHTIISAEAFTYHEQKIVSHPELYGAANRSLLRQGAFLTAADYIQAQRARSVIARQIDQILDGVDALAMPTSVKPASTFADAAWDDTFFSSFNLSGHPAMSIPCGFTEGGLPIGLQLAGRAFGEATLLQIAGAYEQATPWHGRRPSV